MKKIIAAVLSLCLLWAGCACAMADAVTITCARTTDQTISFDESDPEKKSFSENRWNNALLEKLGVDLEYKWISTGDDAMTKWSAAMASNDLPDFAIVSDEVYKLLVDMGAVADCTALWADSISDEYKALLSDSAVDQMTFDGVLRGIPWPSKGYNGANLLFVRQDWLDKLGLAYPQTWEEIVQTAKAFKEAKLGGEDTLGLLVSYESQGAISGAMNVFGAYLDYWVEKDGKLEWSNIQPEMRTALLTFQALYAEGVINQDFAVVTTDLIQEYIVGGKAGIFYSVAFTPTLCLNSLCNTDPTAKISISTIKGVNGEDIQFQTNTPATGKIFINAKCEHPEKIAEIINLVNELTNSTDADVIAAYSWDQNGFGWNKFTPMGDKPANTVNDLAVANEIRLALQAGAASSADYPFTYSDAMNWYDATLAAKNGEGAPGDIWWYYTLGEKGTFTQLYDAYVAGLHLDNGYVGLPTPTQEIFGETVNDQLDTAMREVIMGADISVYDAACEAWLANGGQMITDEVNEASGR